nr:Scr1 family TA system antitoxin-like transcriptional regulator [Haloactinomyces albus]
MSPVLLGRRGARWRGQCRVRTTRDRRLRTTDPMPARSERNSRLFCASESSVHAETHAQRRWMAWQQQRLDCADPLQLTAVIEEAVLDRPVGTVDTMRAQLEHLLELEACDNIDLRVLPTAIGPHAGLSGHPIQ